MSKGTTHNNSLDGLRFLAFLSVFLVHAGLWDLGRYGVTVFFVLSGFLIGRILLQEKRMDRPLKNKLKTFYVRRALRIFPLYYFVLVCFAIGNLIARHALCPPQELLYASVYLSNWWFVVAPHFGPLVHLWTLAIEEQFYLLAPLLLLTVSPRAFQRGFALYLMGLVGLHLWAGSRHMDDFLLVNSFSNFAFLGMGLYLALANEGLAWQWVSPVFIRRIGIACILLLVAYSIVFFGHPLPSTYWHRYAVALASTWIIWDCWHHKLPLLRKFLEFRPVVQLGRISYGLYVYHWPILYFVMRNTTHTKAAIPFCFVLTIIVSVLSWHIIEKPALRLKRLFPYEG